MASVFSGLNDWLEAHVFGPVWAFLKVLVMTGLNAELAALAPIALQAVRDVAADPSLLTNDAKRSAAEAKILSQVTTASLNAVRIAVEVAVANLNAAKVQ